VFLNHSLDARVLAEAGAEVEVNPVSNLEWKPLAHALHQASVEECVGSEYVKVEVAREGSLVTGEHVSCILAVERARQSNGRGLSDPEGLLLH
jgi:hypothetical protein